MAWEVARARGAMCEYRTVCQRWRIVSTVAPAVAAGGGSQESNDDMRWRVQRARIERRLALHELASLVRCEATTLAAYERGDESLDARCLERVRATLNL